MIASVRQLGPADAEALFGLRRNALVAEPFAFLSSPEDDLVASSSDQARLLAGAPEETAVLGAFVDDRLVGMAGITRDGPLKTRHRACVWGVFVESGHRRAGIGARLLEAVVAHARTMPGVETVYLSVSEKTPGARRLYESVGFVVWGLEPDCIRYRGESAREYHLAKSLDPSGR